MLLELGEGSLAKCNRSRLLFLKNSWKLWLLSGCGHNAVTVLVRTLRCHSSFLGGGFAFARDTGDRVVFGWWLSTGSKLELGCVERR